MNWEGFFRSLQGDFMGAIGLLIALLVVYLVALRVIANNEAEIGKKAQVWAHRIFLILVAFILAGMVWRAVVFASVNRMPRADADRSGVYQQMQSHTR